MNCQCAERVTILSLCVCIGIAESWVLHCLSRVSYHWGEKKKRKKKIQQRENGGGLNMGLSVCVENVWSTCVWVSERQEKKGSDCNLFLSYFISERQRASVKYSEKSKMIPAQLMQKVGHLGFALRRDLLTHQSCQSSLSGVFVGFPSRSVWACFRPRPGVLLGGIKRSIFIKLSRIRIHFTSHSSKIAAR